MHDASTQTPDPDTDVEGLLRLEALGSTRRMPGLAQREVIKRVYPAKLAHAFF